MTCGERVRAERPEWMAPAFLERHPRAVPGKKPCRVHVKPRCGVCGLHVEVCLCDELPRVTLPVETVLIQHAFECHRPTNTGRLTHAMLVNSRLLRFGVRGQPLDESNLVSPMGRHFVLFRMEGAQTATRERLVSGNGEPVTVFVLDGSWQHALRMRRRIAALHAMPCLALPPGAPSAWQVRRGRAPEELCTLEACARLVAILGQPDQAQRMMGILTRVNRLTLAMRSQPGPRGQVPDAGALPTDAVGSGHA